MELILALLLAGLAFLLLWLGSRQQRVSGLPAGRVLYADPKLIGASERPLFDADTMLSGKPDYLVEEDGAVIPVEVKSAWAPPQPREGHIFQLLAYCLLVERNTGKRPPYGILHYRDKTFSIPYTSELQRELKEILQAIRSAEKSGEQDRSHQDAARCARCGYRNMCDQRL